MKKTNEQAARKSLWMPITRLALLSVALMGASAAWGVQRQTHWVNADDVLVREKPDTQATILGVLQRGAKLNKLAEQRADDQSGYCYVELDAVHGYVACRFLSAQPLLARVAGKDGTDPALRWVSGRAVNLREKPEAQAPIVARLALNASVRLLQGTTGSGFCEVQLLGSAAQRGFTACNYLVTTPSVSVSWNRGVREAGTPQEAVSEFWASPSWAALQHYATLLQNQMPLAHRIAGPWPRDEALEKMKAHLARGIMGQKPKSLPDWSDTQALALQALQMRQEYKALLVQTTPYASEQIQTIQHLQTLDNQVEVALGYYPADGTPSFEKRDLHLHLAKVLALPSVQKSFFGAESELAPPASDAPALSGRFGIVHRQTTGARPVPAKAKEEEWNPGVYDIQTMTQSLARPLNFVRVFRGGSLRSEASWAKRSIALMLEPDDHEGCADFTYGFAFGDADLAILRYGFGEGADANKAAQEAHKEARKHNPAGSVYALYTNMELPQTKAQVSVTQLRLNRAQTGFVRGTQTHFDLNGDGIIDLAVFEGEGKGPGHLDGPTKTDDRWYRLAFVNVAGRWKILGSDSFGYGCGC